MTNLSVGYRKPPKSSQFKKGQSGNPHGRPKGAKGLNSTLQKIFEKTVTVKEAGISKKIPVAEAVGMRLVEKAIQGDSRAMVQFLAALEKFEQSSSAVSPEQVKQDSIRIDCMSPFNPHEETLSYLSENELIMLDYILKKRDKFLRRGKIDNNPPFDLIKRGDKEYQYFAYPELNL